MRMDPTGLSTDWTRYFYQLSLPTLLHLPKSSVYTCTNCIFPVGILSSQTRSYRDHAHSISTVTFSPSQILDFFDGPLKILRKTLTNFFFFTTVTQLQFEIRQKNSRGKTSLPKLFYAHWDPTFGQTSFSNRNLLYNCLTRLLKTSKTPSVIGIFVQFSKRTYWNYPINKAPTFYGRRLSRCTFLIWCIIKKPLQPNVCVIFPTARVHPLCCGRR